MSELPSQPSPLVYLLPGLHRPSHRRSDPQPVVLTPEGQLAYRKNCAGIVNQLAALGLPARVAKGVKDHAFLFPLEEIAWHEQFRNRYRVANARKVRDYEKERAALEVRTPSLHDLGLEFEDLESALRWLSEHSTRPSVHKNDRALVFNISPIPLTPPWTKANGHKAAPTFVGYLSDGTKVYRYRSGGVKTNATALGLNTRSSSLDEAWFTAEEYATFQKFQASRNRPPIPEAEPTTSTSGTPDYTDMELDALIAEAKERAYARDLLRLTTQLADLLDWDAVAMATYTTMIRRFRQAAYRR